MTQDENPSLYETSQNLFGRASGYRPMAPRPNTRRYQPAFSFVDVPPPPKVDLRPFLTTIEDQGDTNSCVAHAIAGAYDYWLKKSGQATQSLSRMFIYYNARLREGSQDKDDGSVIQLAMEGLKDFGACPEMEWPFEKDLLFEKPLDEIYQDAAAFRVLDMEQVALEPEAWKRALAEGKPIVFGILLFKSFDSCDRTGGVVAMPAPSDLARNKHSGHSMCAVGYNDAEKVFIVRNSWGTDFGDAGYCYMPYAYLMNPRLNDGDCWVFKPKIDLPPPQETWSHDTKPVTNAGKGVDFQIETYTLADYAHIALDLFLVIRQPFVSGGNDEFAQYVEPARQDLVRQFSKLDVRGLVEKVVAKLAPGDGGKTS